MLTQRKLIVSLALILSGITASAGSLFYVVNGSQFGTVDLTSGAFSPIGPGTPEGADGLIPQPNGSLLTLAFTGNLDSINPATGAITLIGATGLADCLNYPVSPCGPTSANTIAQLGGTIYATDIANDLYTVNPSTGHATLIGPTGIPAVPAAPLSTNPDGTFNAFDEALFSAGGNLYATFDAFTVDPSTFAVTPVISPDLYQINPSTGYAALIAPTTLNIGAVVNVNGIFYAFDDSTSQVLTLNLANGDTTFVSNFDAAAGLIDGASPVPESASVALAGFGIAAILLLRPGIYSAVSTRRP